MWSLWFGSGRRVGKTLESCSVRRLSEPQPFTLGRREGQEEPALQGLHDAYGDDIKIKKFNIAKNRSLCRNASRGWARPLLRQSEARCDEEDAGVSAPAGSTYLVFAPLASA
jgi:hypothetical protein